VTIRATTVRRAALGAAAAVIATTGMSAHPAYSQAARQECDQDVARVIKIPRQPDVRIANQVCVIAWPQGNGAFKYKAWVHTTWSSIGGGKIGKRFEHYHVQARLEFNPADPDTDIEVANCDLFPPLNRYATGSETCDTFPSKTFKEVDPAFTGDATIRYDVNGDGKGSRRLQMRGTHRV
jgi:hypothetical protein